VPWRGVALPQVTGKKAMDDMAKAESRFVTARVMVSDRPT
jgi:hypothetical protein